MQATGEHVAGAHVVVRGHDEVREFGLCRRLVRERGIFARDAVGPECPQQIELRAARAFRAMVGEIDDVALERPVDRAVRFIDKTLRLSEHQ